MPTMLQERLTCEERDRLLSLAWLSQKEFAQVMEITPNTLCQRLKRGDYKGLYIMLGASRKFDSRKIKKFLNLTEGDVKNDV